MAKRDKELEEQLVEVGSKLASPPSDSDELLSLLDQTERFLSRVEQSPSESMFTALHPAMKALVTKKLLNHSEMDLKVAVASCITEVTRITAPYAPYNDELMKEIFRMIVDAFENLDDISNRSYSKRVSILENVANIRSCVVMLDLECDALVLKMFQHFLKTIRPSHTKNVFSSMEAIMTLVLEESEAISSELLSCLLLSVKEDNKDVLPIGRRLGEKVIGNCAVKLEPYLVELIQSTGASLGDYSNIVDSICQQNSDAPVRNELNASGEHLESKKLESEVVYPEEIGSAADNSERLVMSSGTFSTWNDNSVVEPTSPEQKSEHACRIVQSEGATITSRAELGNLSCTTDIKLESLPYPSTMKTRGRSNSLIHSDTTDHSQIDSDKKALAVPGRRGGRSKETNSLQSDGPSGKRAEALVCSEPDMNTEIQPSTGLDIQPSTGLDSEYMSVSSAAPFENIPDINRPKGGRPSGSEFTANEGGISAVADQPASTSGHKGTSDNGQTGKETLPSKDVDSKKEHEVVCDLKGKPLKHLVKKELDKNANDGEIPAQDVSCKKEVDGISDSIVKPLEQTSKKRSTRNITEKESSGKHKKSKIKQRKGKHVKGLGFEEYEPLLDSLTAPTKDQYNLEAIDNAKSRRKRARGKEEVSEAQNHVKELGENLVGSIIKVWWPDDKKFYDGVVESFDPFSKKHKIVYFDGDVEILLLSDERWELIEDYNKTDGGKPEDNPSSNASPEISKETTNIRASWSQAHEKYLLELLLKFNVPHYPNQNGWSCEGWTKIVEALNKKFPTTNWTEIQVREHEAMLKKDFNLIKKLRNNSGMSWDDAGCMLVASDEVWASLIEANKDVKKWKYKTFPHYDALESLYDGDLFEGLSPNNTDVRGNENEKGNELITPQLPSDPNPIGESSAHHMSPNKTGDDFLDKQCMTPLITQIQPQAVFSSQTLAPPSSERMSRKKQMTSQNQVAEFMNGCMEMQNGESMDRVQVDHFSISRCVEVLNEMTGFTTEELVKATDVFTKKSSREIFLSLKQELQSPWLRARILGG